MEFNIKLDNSCKKRKPFCVNCHNHFMSLRPQIKGVVISKYLIKDLKDQEQISSIVQDVLDCSSANFTELHKFEEHINGNPVFRAKTGKIHIVYSINKNMQIIFLRAFKNFKKYKRFLDDKNGIRHMLPH